SLIALYPLASHLLLSSDIEIESWLPRDIIREADPKLMEKEIKHQLTLTQMSFSDVVNISLHPASSERSVIVRINLKCPLGLDEIFKIYDGVYDDHNFTFISDRTVQIAEVVGTQKCIITFNKPGAGLLEIICIADARMRGGAGDAVHIMNLLFALHEKVGLTFKPSIYSSDTADNPDEKENTPTHSDWFA
ncbi:MAG: hypothetical protein K2M10_08310, partial [Muribaculaceae bacterium]|nr:hypothetical protein [Muribaculaceae bacterium]